MGRKYDTGFFKNLIERFKNKRRDMALGFDVIVGLPGETDELFLETYNLLKEMDFCYLHVFVYSKRSGTRAAKMPNQVHGKISKERSAKLLQLSKDKTEIYIRGLVESNARMYVVAESIEDGFIYGTSDHYVRCRFKAEHFEKGSLCLVESYKAEAEIIDCILIRDGI
jgi:threonylcarbamoyladenosine tRNA methylthiotransferase MtaB